MSGRPQTQHVEYPRIVVKIGTNVLTAGSEDLNTSAMADLVDQIASMRARGIEVLLVTSGAIVAGRHRIHASNAVRDPHPRDIQARQAFAAVGQGRLMSLWDGLFEQHDVVTAQALLTGTDLADRVSYLNARNTLIRLVELGVVPIINENDVVSVEEIDAHNIGDNDHLSAQVANLVDADLLLLLTDIAGLYSADPARDPDAHLIEQVPRVDEAILQAAAALRHGGNSLLPAGVTAAEGEFARGDVVHVYGADGEHLATGLANYDRAEVEQISGKHSDQIVQVLGYEYSEEIIHRNNLVLV